MSSGISSVSHHNPHINVFVVYLLIQELFVEKINYFKFLFTDDKLWLQQLKTTKVLLFVERFTSIDTRKEKYLVLRRNAKPQQLIKHSVISYSIVILLYLKFSLVTYENDLNRSVSKLRHSKYLRKYESHQFDTFCRESAF